MSRLSRNVEYKDYGYTSSHPENKHAGEELAASFVAAVRSLPAIKTVCDLGCGNGYLASRLGQQRFNVTGIDASPTGIDIATKHYESPLVQFICAEIGPTLINRLQASPRFDAVISSDVIEHLYRPRELITCAHQLLNPGGWLVLGTPYHGYLKNLALSVVNHWDTHHTVLWDGGHIKFFSVKTLSQMVKDGGFRIEYFKYFGRVHWLWKGMICIARKVN